MDKLIKLTKVSKKYNQNIILEDIDLEINKGDSIALTGHNGGGKSTLLDIIADVTKCSDGSINYKDNIRISYVPDKFPKMNITAVNYLMDMADIIGIDKAEAKRICNEHFKNFFMESMIDTPIKYLSKGTQQKVVVIQALLTKPDVLLLDEPLSGQDADSQKYFIETIKNLNKDGTAIVMACHEKWLISMISKDIYAVENHHLIKKESINENENAYVIMQFEKNKMDTKEADDFLDIDKLALKIEKNNNIVKLVVKRKNSSAVIIKMLNEGYELRRLEDEKFN